MFSARLDDSHVRGFILKTRDITERKQLGSSPSTGQDSLCGLAATHCCATAIQPALNRAARSPAVLMFHLDGFKTLNDSLGHSFRGTAPRRGR